MEIAQQDLYKVVINALKRGEFTDPLQFKILSWSPKAFERNARLQPYVI